MSLSSRGRAPRGLLSGNVEIPAPPMRAWLRGLIPAPPMRAWLRGLIGRYDGDRAHVAALLGVTVGNLDVLIRPRDRRCVRLDTVDRLFCNAGEPWRLRELYPDLYLIPDEEMAA